LKTLAELDKRVLSCVRRTPGMRADEIAHRIKEPRTDVCAALRRLKGDPRRSAMPRVRCFGNTRSATYAAV
jgi:hypothetical protein